MGLVVLVPESSENRVRAFSRVNEKAAKFSKSNALVDNFVTTLCTLILLCKHDYLDLLEFYL